MSVRGFLLWYLGAVLLVGSAGATGYQVLSRHRAQLAAREAAEPSAIASPPEALAAAQPVAPSAVLPEASPSPATDEQSRTAAAESHRRTAASARFRLPALRPHLAASDHALRPDRRVARRPTTLALATRPAHHPAALAVAARAPAPHPVAGRYTVALRPPGGYAEPPPPSVRYYAYPGAYPGYPGYQPGYAYYYPGYRYYRVY